MAELVRFLEIWWFWIDWGALAAAVLSIPSVLLRRRGRPLSAVSWILALLSIPLLGIFLWWLFGRSHLERRRHRKRRAHLTMTQKLATLRDQLGDQLGPAESGQPMLLPAKNLPPEMAANVFPATAGNAVELMDSHDAFDIMERDIAEAKHHIHALFYIWKDDETGRRFRDALIERARAGVEVRVLCDAIGSPAMATKFIRKLRKAGAKCVRFLPPELFTLTPRLNFRNHRKILVVDGKVGVIGGFNIGDEYRKEWRDLGVRIIGPAVDQLQEIFADDWYYATHEDTAVPDYFGRWLAQDHATASCSVVASGPDSSYAAIHEALFMAINETRERLYIMTPYFIPPQSIGAALRAAVYRGVDVRVMVPALSDVMIVRHAARAYYPELVDVGVRILEYQPAMLHAKAALFDDELVMIGSANIDSRSFRLNFEASCFIRSRELNQAVLQQFVDNQAHSEEIVMSDLDKLPWATKLTSAVAHLLSPLL